jgi:putative ABC transport system ATP-binding protein
MIETQQLQFAYGAGQPLVFPDVAVPQGAVVLLSGLSGSGKSTWLALLAALVKPQNGALTVAGQDLRALSGRSADAWRARNIGFLPQKLYLIAALTVQHNLELAFWAAGLPVDRPRVRRVLAQLNVAELAQRFASQLSGGQAQRVALARAVLMQPRLILADEPTASLDDAAAQGAVQMLVHAAKEQNATLVIATHDARVAQAVSACSDVAPILLHLSPAGSASALSTATGRLQA